MKEICLLMLVLSPLLARATNYYVNDASTTGDVYCTAVGNAANAGLAPGSPKISVQAIVSSYTLAGGDIVYIDAGTYTEDLLLSGLNGAGVAIRFVGASTALTTIQGIPGGANPYTLQMMNSSYLRWSNMSIVGSTGEWAIRVYDNSDYNEFANCNVSGLYGFDFIDMFGGGSPDYNKVHDCIVQSPYVGIRFKYGASRNEVYDSRVTVTSTGPNVFSALEFQSANNNLAYRNVLSSVGRSDEGTVHSGQYATGNVLINNYILNLTAPSGAFQNSAVEVDDNAGLTLIHNSVYSVGPCFHMDPLTGVTTETNMALRNNIFYSTGSDCISLTTNTSKFGECDNNLYFAPSGSVANTGGTTRNLASWKAYDPDVAAFNEVNGLYGNPLFSAPASNNLDLSSITSPAANAVVNVIATVVDDIYKTSRPQGPAWEIGAHEIIVLPVKLLNFSTECQDKGVLLSWITAEEKDNHFFTLENSTDAIHFSSTGIIKGAGNSNVISSYQFLDTLREGNYYRLKQTDVNGMSSYSSIIQANCLKEKSKPVQVWNHGSQITIVFASNGDDTCIANLYNVKGQLLFSEQHLLSKGNSSWMFEPKGLADGLYILQVTKGGKIYSEKIMVQF